MKLAFAGILAVACGALQALASPNNVSGDSVHQKLVDLAAKNGGVVPLDESLFDKITSNNREWSVAIEFTALTSNMKCAPCREFDPSFRAVAKSWAQVEPSFRDQHFFATLEFAEATEVFRRLGLVSAPVLNYYPAARGPRRPSNGKTEPSGYEFNTHGFGAEELAAELSKYTPATVPYTPPFNWGLLTTTILGIISAALTFRFVLPILTSRWTWAAVTIIASIVFNSGIMFVRIRGMPWVGQTRQGTSWLAGGYQNQYGMEVQVIAGIYGTLAFSYLALIFLVPRITSPFKQRLAIYIWCTVIFLLYSVMLSLFRVKNPLYPFRLFL